MKVIAKSHTHTPNCLSIPCGTYTKWFYVCIQLLLLLLFCCTPHRISSWPKQHQSNLRRAVAALNDVIISGILYNAPILSIMLQTRSFCIYLISIYETLPNEHNMKMSSIFQLIKLILLLKLFSSSSHHPPKTKSQSNRHRRVLALNRCKSSHGI